MHPVLLVDGFRSSSQHLSEARDRKNTSREELPGKFASRLGSWDMKGTPEDGEKGQVFRAAGKEGP